MPFMIWATLYSEIGMVFRADREVIIGYAKGWPLPPAKKTGVLKGLELIMINPSM